MDNLGEIVFGEKFYRLTLIRFFVFPTKENLERAGAYTPSPDCKKTLADWIKQFKCEVDILEPNELFMIVGVDKEKSYIKILGRDKMGWVNLRNLNSIELLKESIFNEKFGQD